MSNKPAILGGTRVISADQQPLFPQIGLMESAILAEITETLEWVGFRWKPAVYRAIMEQVVADTQGYAYAVGQANGTLAIGSGFRAQLLTCSAGWAEGRDELLVPAFTCMPAFEGAMAGIARQLGRVPRLVLIDAKPDCTIDETAVETHLREHADRVLGMMPTTLYGNFPAMGTLVDLSEWYDVLCHHDDAQGAGARYEGKRAPTASLSFHADGKPTPTCEGGATLATEPDLARFVRADTDCGVGPGRHDPIPYAEMPKLAAGNQRMGEQPAGLLLVQWMRALHARVIARENRRVLQGLLSGSELHSRPLLWNPPEPSEWAPFYTLYLSCLPALEEDLGLSPRDLRAALTEDGLCAEPPFVPAHMDPSRAHWPIVGGGDYSESEQIYRRGLILHTKHLRDPRFISWFTEILGRIVEHAEELRGIAEGRPDPIC